MKRRAISLILVLLMFAAIMPQAKANNSKIVALTFDDGPSWKFTPGLLDALGERGVRATFFLVGYCLEVNMDLAQRTFDEGHQLANHSYSHTWFSRLTADAIKKELEETNALLSEITGETDFMIRVPYGDVTSNTKKVAPGPLMQWSVDPANGRTDISEDKMFSTLMSTVRDGSIIILHDTNQKNVNVAIRAVDALLKEGYEFVTLDELFRLRGVTLESGAVYYNVPQSPAETAFDEARLKEHWAYKSIQTVMKKGIIKGDGVGFKPNEYLSRAMASTVLMRLATTTNKMLIPGADSEFVNILEGQAAFSDVAEGLWYSDAVAWAHASSYVKGVSETTFDPDSFITKEQFYTILARFATSELEAVPTFGNPVSYRDDERISNYARDSVMLIRSAGFSSKNDREIFRPADNITRAEAAELVDFMMTLIGSQQEGVKATQLSSGPDWTKLWPICVPFPGLVRLYWLKRIK